MQVAGARIVVMQSIQYRGGHDGAGDKRRTLVILLRDLLLNPLMRPCLVVIVHILLHQTMQLQAMQNQDVIQTLPFQAADEPLADTIGLHRQLHP